MSTFMEKGDGFLYISVKEDARDFADGVWVTVQESGFDYNERCFRGWSGNLVTPFSTKSVTVEEIGSMLDQFLKLVIP